MNKLLKHILIPVIITIILIITISVLVNSFFIEKYTLYQQKNNLNEAFIKIKNSSNDLNLIDELERMYNITIIIIPFSEDEDEFNELLRNQLQNRNIGFKKLWLWKNGFEKLKENKKFTQLYNQEQLKYSILVQYNLYNEKVYAVTMNIPHSAEILKNINKISFIIFFFGTIIMVLLISITIKKAIKPIEELTQLAKDLSEQKFKTIKVHTYDEIETLANSFNYMSISLKESQDKLKEKNKDMENLLSNVSHEIKTPAAIIKAYSSGIKDGLDDGTFLDEIIKQNENITEIVEKLLKISSIKKSEKNIVEFSLSDSIIDILNSLSIIINEKKDFLVTDISQNILIAANKEDINIMLNNLITNAIKYGISKIYLSLKLENKIPVFEVSNDILPDSNIDIDKIWNYFYVGDISRNKLLTGTGLGLAIVKTIAQKYGYIVLCDLKDNRLVFTVKFN